MNGEIRAGSARSKIHAGSDSARGWTWKDSRWEAICLWSITRAVIRGGKGAISAKYRGFLIGWAGVRRAKSGLLAGEVEHRAVANPISRVERRPIAPACNPPGRCATLRPGQTLIIGIPLVKKSLRSSRIVPPKLAPGSAAVPRLDRALGRRWQFAGDVSDRPVVCSGQLVSCLGTIFPTLVTLLF